ncbi:MAG: methyl-accepting chemotaxis protein [Pseudomonadota bacterium]
MDSIKRLIRIVTVGLEKRIKMTGQEKISISTIQKQLAGLSDTMGTIIAGSEPDFIHLGSDLQSIFSTAVRLSDIVIQSAQGCADDSEEKILVRISGFAKESVDKLKGCRNRISESLSILDSGKSDLERLAGLCSKQEKISMLLNVIALNIAVESSRNRQSSEMFIVFAQEIKQVSENMKDITRNLYGDSVATCNRQTTIQTEIAVRFNQLSTVTVGAENIVSEAVKKIDQLSILFEDAMQNGIRYSKEISDQVAEVVMAIQFHDIVRQQIEHVVQALGDTERLCREEDSAADTENVPGKIYAILQIQAAQIQQVILEIENAEGRITRSLENIEIKASRLVACLSESFVFRNGAEGSSDNPFVILIQSLEELGLLLNQAYDLQSLMDGAATEASSSVSGLAGHTKKVQDISLDLHRKALNAIIKSAHLGEMGTTFEILAQEVTAVSEESNLFANQVIRMIDSVSSLAGRLGSTGRNSIGEDAKEMNRSEFQVDEEVSKIKDTYRLFLENTSRASEISKELETSIRETRVFVSFLKTLLEQLNVPLKKIEKTMEELSPWKNDSENQAKDIPDAAKRYTMESERVIHSQIMGQNHPREKQDDPVSDTPSEEAPVELFSDDDQTNIELFDETASDPEPVEWFESDPDTKDHVEAPEEEKNDNIELF